MFRFEKIVVWACLCAWLAAAAPVPARAQKSDAFHTKRLRMVAEFIEAEGISNKRVLEAMRSVPRHEFVAHATRSHAYEDMALPIGNAQTISPPFIVAYMTQAIDPQPEDRVLEIGTGSGYQAAILSGLVKEVYTIEIVEPLGKAAAARLKSLGYKNVTVKVGDGYQGWKEHAPFDKIIVTCSPENVPQPLIEQLVDGGTMIVPLGERYQQTFYLFEKKGGKLIQTQLIPTLFVPMTGVSDTQRTVKPDPARPGIVNGSFEETVGEENRLANWHYQRQARLESDGAPEGKQFLTLEYAAPGRMAQSLQGIGVDGRKVREMRVSLSVRYAGTRKGAEANDVPALVVHFFDDTRRPIGEGVVGPWLGTAGWTEQSTRINVPLRAREAIVGIGLNGATGALSVDNVRLSPVEE